MAQRLSLHAEERIKNQGMSLQRKALRSPDLVSLYGSSELRKLVTDKAGIFFSSYPTGFAVFQVGRAGSTCLNLLQKVGAAAPLSGPRRVAISLSSTWFLDPVDPRYYAGNFSKQQALAVLFDPRLSFALKSDLAQRMLQYPRTVPPGSLLALTLQHLAANTAWDRAVYRIMRPLGLLQNAVYSAQDHFETALYILDHRGQWQSVITRATAALDWPALLAKAAQESSPHREGDMSARDRHLNSDAAYRETLDRSLEWGDLELLLRTFQELNLDPLILSMPPDGLHYEGLGVTRAGLAEYSRRLHALCDRYHTRVESFDDHLEDSPFLMDHHDHMSVKGWMYYNQAIDDFFHRRGR